MKRTIDTQTPEWPSKLKTSQTFLKSCREAVEHFGLKKGVASLALATSITAAIRNGIIPIEETSLIRSFLLLGAAPLLLSIAGSASLRLVETLLHTADTINKLEATSIVLLKI